MADVLFSPTFLPLFADVVLAGLLVATLVVAIRLNGRLAVLRHDRNRLGELITGLGKASSKAEEAVAGLRVSASESGRSLQDRIERAGALAADMNFLIEKAERLADRLEAAFRVEREAAQAARPPLDLETFAPPRAHIGARPRAGPAAPGDTGARDGPRHRRRGAKPARHSVAPGRSAEPGAAHGTCARSPAARRGASRAAGRTEGR